jgi:hypothetical protein
VPAKSSRQVTVTVSIAERDVSALPAAAPDHGPSVAEDAVGNTFTTLTTVRGAIVATPRTSGKGIYPLRVPWMVVPRGLSDVRPSDGSRTDWTIDGALRRSSISVGNHGLHRGFVDVYSWGLSDTRDGLRDIDLRAAGVQSLPTEVCTGFPDSSDRCLLFAINTWGSWSNAAANDWVVSIDTDLDGDEDYLIVGTDDGLVFDGEENGVLDSLIIDASTNELVDAFLGVAPARGSTLVLPALASDFGLHPDGATRFDYLVSATSFGDSPQGDVMDNLAHSGGDFERARYDAFRPVIRNGFFQSVSDGRSVTVPLVVDADRYNARRGMRGWLVVTLDDANGAAQADTLSVGALP